jgi:dTMP kinase
MPLIVLEGPEGAGKTTQAAMLAERLGDRGRRVLLFREPGGTALGDEIRRLLLEPGSDIGWRAESLLFMASRAQLVEREITHVLAAGALVILDRFYLSTYAYQIAGRGLPAALVEAANRLAVGDVRPDLTVLLAVGAAHGMARAMRRGPRDRMEQADSAFHERVTGAFEEFATAAWQAAHPEAGPVVRVDAGGSVEDVHARVLAAVRAAVPAL